MRLKRIGVFGGSFSPVHHGHLLVARAAFERLKLDELIFIPCGRSAYKKKIMPATLRLKMLRSALRGVKGFKVSDVEPDLVEPFEIRNHGGATSQKVAHNLGGCARTSV